MCWVSKICFSCSQDFLYRDICVTHSSRKVHRTLAESTHHARKVRSFESSCNNKYLAMALRNMTSLRILKFSGDFPLKILDGCTFKLDSFECTDLIDCVNHFPKYLSSQPSLKYVAFPKTCVTMLEATCLPNLTRINAKFSWLPYLIPGRPLNEVITTGATSRVHSIDLSFFALSTTPIQKLTIDYSYLYSTPAYCLASFLPSLTHFTLTVWNHYTSFEYEGVCGLPLY
jgi:hypothetical protein